MVARPRRQRLANTNTAREHGYGRLVRAVLTCTVRDDITGRAAAARTNRPSAMPLMFTGVLVFASRAYIHKLIYEQPP